MSAFEIASQSEQLLWQTIQQNKNGLSNTLSYQFSIPQVVSLEDAQQAIFRLLTEHCRSLSYRFFQRDGILYKQFISPSESPIKFLATPKKSQKKLFTETLIPLYQFEWHEALTENHLICHLSHLVFDGACYDDFGEAIALAFKNDKPHLNIFAQEPTVSSEDMHFWQQELKDKRLYQHIPFFDQSVNKEYVAKTYSISSDFFSDLKKFNHKHNVTIFQTIATAFAILLNYYLQDNETNSQLFLSYCVSTRKKADPVGCYFNLLPLFIHCDPNATVLDILNNVKLEREKQKVHQHVILNQLTPFINEKINRHQPLFNIVINHSPGLLPFGSAIGIDNRSGEKQLSLLYNYNEDKLVFRLESNAGLIFDELLEQMLSNLSKTLNFIINNSKKSIGKLDLSTQEIPLSTGRILPKKTQPLINYFITQAENHLNKIAIHSNTETLAYKELINLVNLFGKAIYQIDKPYLAQGIGIYLPHSCYLPATLLACLQQQVPFIPLSTELPLLAINELIKETQLSVVFSDEKNSRTLSTHNPFLQIINIDPILKNKDKKTKVYPSKYHNQSVAYTLFTSGSTGKPKGVLVTYDNLFNFLRSMSTHPGITEHDKLLAMTAISFDISLNELLLPLFCGATIFIVDDLIRKNSKQLVPLIEKHNITIVQTTPSNIQLFKQTTWEHKQPELRFWVGGEALPLSVAQYLEESNYPLFNMYGPTETTIWVATTRVEKNKPIVLGSAVDNTQLFIIDTKGKTPPLGMCGELIISGAQVAQGYSNHSNTAFTEDSNGLKRYHTGDKVMALSSDHIIFIKRLDEQIKVRGHRVELQEINQKIRAIEPNIEVVTVLKAKPESHLCSFYTVSNSIVIDSNQLLIRLKKYLPDYKIPQALICMPSFPLTSSGKIDKKALIDLDLSTISSSCSQQSTEIKSSTFIKSVDALRALIQNNFDIDIKEDRTPLTYYGFNSLSFNLLSAILEKHFNILIRPHEFYRWGDLTAIAKRCEQGSSGYHEPLAKPKLQPERSQTRIAIIGYDALLPGGLDAEAFWQILISQTSMISAHQREGLSKNEKAGFIDKIDTFDRRFFNISPLEALRMDPRQRLLLQCAYKTLEHAGYSAISLRGKKVGCFIAGTGNDYLVAQEKKEMKAHPYTLSGNALTMLANRLSYYFDWKGPSMTIDTACSGALSALIRAVENISLNNSSICFVGAANIIADNHITDALTAGNFLSAKAQCASFSDQADGYVRGEGVIGFLLKAYDAAIEDNDHIYGVIESVAENHGGHAQSLTAPNQDAQTALLMDAYNNQLGKQVSYIETHGTGTQLGDPIEIDALKDFEQKALQHSTQDVIYLGAVKGNIGHLEAAAGFASILKVLLAMKYQALPANIQESQTNPLISLTHSKLKLLDANQKWNTSDRKDVVAGVSAFGFGGSNTHVVISSHATPMQNIKPHYNEPLLFVLSAKSQIALQNRIKALIKDIQHNNSILLPNIAYTLATGRDRMPHRLAFVASNKQSLLTKLQNYLNNEHLSQPKIQNEVLQPYINAYFSDETVPWETLFNKKMYRRIPLTSYIFESEAFWFTSLLDHSTANKFLLDSLTIKQLNKNKLYIKIPSNHLFLSEHQVFKQKVLPGVVHIELALQLLKLNDLFKYPITIENFYWLRPIICQTEDIDFIIITEPTTTGFQIKLTDQQGILYSKGNINYQTPRILTSDWQNEVKAHLNNSSLIRYNSTHIYQKFSKLGIYYGDYFQGITHVDVHQNIAKAYLSVKPLGSMASLLDSALQSGMAISLNNNEPGLMPFALGSMTILRPIELSQLSNACVYTQKLSAFRTNLMICNSEDVPLLTLVDLGVKPSLIKEIHHEIS